MLGGFFSPASRRVSNQRGGCIALCAEQNVVALAWTLSDSTRIDDTVPFGVAGREEDHKGGIIRSRVIACVCVCVCERLAGTGLAVCLVARSSSAIGIASPPLSIASALGIPSALSKKRTPNATHSSKDPAPRFLTPPVGR